MANFSGKSTPVLVGVGVVITLIGLTLALTNRHTKSRNAQAQASEQQADAKTNVTVLNVPTKPSVNAPRSANAVKPAASTETSAAMMVRYDTVGALFRMKGDAVLEGNVTFIDRATIDAVRAAFEANPKVMPAKPADKPLAGATVHIYFETYGQPLRTVKTDENGYYKFAGLKPDMHNIIVQHPDVADNYSVARMNPKDAVTKHDIMVIPGNDVRVSVIDCESGATLPDVKIALQYTIPQRAETTDANGEALFKNVTMPLRCMLQKDGYYQMMNPHEQQTITLSGFPGSETSMTLAMRKGSGTIRGQLVDEIGTPIRASAIVTTFIENAGNKIVKVADGDGKFEFPNAPADRDLKVRGLYGDYGPYVEFALAHGEVKDIKVQIPRAVHVTGTAINDATNAPMPTLHIYYRSFNNTSGYTVTDDAGMFTFFSFVKDGAYTIRIEEPGMKIVGDNVSDATGRSVASIALVPGATTDQTTIRLKSTPTLTAKITNIGNTPTAALVCATHTTDDGQIIETETEIGATGELTLNLPENCTKGQSWIFVKSIPQVILQNGTLRRAGEYVRDHATLTLVERTGPVTHVDIALDTPLDWQPKLVLTDGQPFATAVPLEVRYIHPQTNLHVKAPAIAHGYGTYQSQMPYAKTLLTFSDIPELAEPVSVIADTTGANKGKAFVYNPVTKAVTSE